MGAYMRTEMIRSYVDQLSKTFGKVRAPVDDEDLLRLFKAKDYTGMVGFIRKSMNLQCRIRLGVVNSGGPSAPAWVQIPSFMPLAGTKEFKNLLITMYLRRNFAVEGSFEQVVSVIAHELSHIVLDSLFHQLSKMEEAVDLTAMMLGYRDFYLTSRHCVSLGSDTVLGNFQTLFSKIFGDGPKEELMISQVGYLSLEEIRYAANYMSLGK